MAENEEAGAFLAWLLTFELSRPVEKLSDLSDGSALFDVLSTVYVDIERNICTLVFRARCSVVLIFWPDPSDPEHFRNASQVSTQLPDNWPLRFTALKRLFRLISQYYTEVLRQPTSAIDVPDLQAIAKDYDVDQTLALCRLTIALAVQSSQNQKIIGGIQQLEEANQHALMRAIETVCISYVRP